MVCSFDRSCVWDRTYEALNGANFSVAFSSVEQGSIEHEVSAWVTLVEFG